MTGSDGDGTFSGTMLKIKLSCHNTLDETCTKYDSTGSPKLTPKKSTKRQVNVLVKLDSPQQITFNDQIQPIFLPSHITESANLIQ